MQITIIMRLKYVVAVLILLLIIPPTSASTISEPLKDELAKKGEARAIVRLKGDCSELLSYLKAEDVKYRYLLGINAISLKLNESLLSEISKFDCISSIDLDYELYPMEEILNLFYPSLARVTAEKGDLWNLRMINVTGVWNEGIRGKGVRIAIIDTGVNASHPELSGKVVEWKDFVNERASPYDDNGHGTHVAAIASGRTVGVAPESEIVAVKVLNSRGRGYFSDVYAGVEWASKRADVISMSLGLYPVMLSGSGGLVKPGTVGKFTYKVYDGLPEGGRKPFKPAFTLLSFSASLIDHVFVAPPYGNVQEFSRTFDLRNVSKATLSFWLSANFYGNGYFKVVLTDGNASKTVYSVSSGKFTKTVSLDISEFAGKVVTVKFVAYGWKFVVLDDVSIPEIKFYDGFEKDTGWIAKRWWKIFYTSKSDVKPEVKVLSPSGEAVSLERIGRFYKVSSDGVLESGNWTVVVNNTFGEWMEFSVRAYTAYPSDGTDSLSQLVNNVSSSVPVVVAAGNAGYFGKMTIASPGCAKKSITVGAVDSNGNVAWFSSRGPVGFENGYVKPDVVAPGYRILSASNEGGYIYMSGTSMATPHVSGVVALMLQKDRSLSPDEIKKILESAAKDVGAKGKDVDSGSGLIDTYRSVKLIEKREFAVKGFVVNSVGKPVAQAKITAGGKTALTNDSGYFELRLKEDNYSLTFEKAGYQTKTVEVFVDGDETINVTLKDVKPPFVEILYPENGTVINASSFECKFTAKDSETGVFAVKILLDGREVNETIRASDGWHVLEVVATDYDGNENFTSVKFRVDTIKPEIIQVIPESGSFVSGVFEIKIRASEELSSATAISDNVYVMKKSGEFWVAKINASSVVKIVVTDMAGNTNSIEVRYLTKSDVIPRFTFYPTNPTKFQFVHFDASKSEGNVVKYVWDFGDGCKAEGVRVRHYYRTPGQFTVTLTVMSESGAKFSVSKTITVKSVNEPPTANFRYYPVTPKAGEKVLFVSNAKDPDGYVVYREWIINGTKMRGYSVTFTFEKPGTYEVVHRVKDNWGNWAEVKKVLTVE